ncbi:hypothetical protein SGLAM104S_06239 [Streptomyces glaucescens]
MGRIAGLHRGEAMCTPRGRCRASRGTVQAVVGRHADNTYDVARIAEMSNCSRTFSLTMVPPAVSLWL